MPFPPTHPALAQALATNSTDVINSVNPMFAAAGRLASPDNYQALGRGITQGSTGILQNASAEEQKKQQAMMQQQAAQQQAQGEMDMQQQAQQGRTDALAQLAQHLQQLQV